MSHSLAKHYLADIVRSMLKQKTLAERAIDQIDEQQLFATLGEESNSIAIIMKHMAGNMRSRWTDFLTTDGEKPDRARDTEFENDPRTTRATVMAWWEDGWKRTFDAITSLSPEDLERSITIRGEMMSVLEAINRQLAHYAQHVGQIVLLAKYYRGAEWQSLSIPKKKRP
jgi:hypothetical protein